MLTISIYQLLGAYPEIDVDIMLSDDGDDDVDVGCPVGQTDLTCQDDPSLGPLPATDDAEVLGKISAKTVMTGARGTTVLRAADRAKAAPASGAQGRKHPCIATRRSEQGLHATHVTTQVELPCYHGSWSPRNRVLPHI
jgi:hypothetical protein